MNNSITTKQGTFVIKENEYNKAFTDLYHNGIRIATVKAYWWDAQALEKAIERNADDIKQKKNAHAQINVNEDNVINVLELANELLKNSVKDTTEQDFICSRLSEVVGKLKKSA